MGLSSPKGKMRDPFPSHPKSLSPAAQSRHPAAPEKFCLQGGHKNSQELQFQEAAEKSWVAAPQQPEPPPGESFAGLPFKALTSLQREGFFCLVLAPAALSEQHQNLPKLPKAAVPGCEGRMQAGRDTRGAEAGCRNGEGRTDVPRAPHNHTDSQTWSHRCNAASQHRPQQRKRSENQTQK